MQSLPWPPAPLRVHDEGAGRVVLEAEAPAAGFVVVSGYDGPALPSRLVAAVLEPVGPRAWRLSTDEGAVEFRARGMEVLAPQPALFDKLLAPFALKPRDRRLVRVLLKLLRLPGGAWLLRRWHARRQ
jgi:hypothetical protein